MDASVVFFMDGQTPMSMVLPMVLQRKKSASL
jgi:hypothetical protein